MSLYGHCGMQLYLMNSHFLLEMFAIIYTSIYFHPIHFILKFPRNILCMWVIKALG